MDQRRSLSTHAELAIAAVLVLVCGCVWILNLETRASFDGGPVLLFALLAIRIVPLGVLIGMAVRQPIVGLLAGILLWIICVAGAVLFWLWIGAALGRA